MRKNALVGWLLLAPSLVLLGGLVVYSNEAKAALAHSKARVDYGLWGLMRSSSTAEQLEGLARAGAKVALAGRDAAERIANGLTLWADFEPPEEHSEWYKVSDRIQPVQRFITKSPGGTSVDLYEFWWADLSRFPAALRDVAVVVDELAVSACLLEWAEVGPDHVLGHGERQADVAEPDDADGGVPPLQPLLELLRHLRPGRAQWSRPRASRMARAIASISSMHTECSIR